MQPAEYVQMAEVQDRHWWFEAKRRTVDALLTRYGVGDTDSVSAGRELFYLAPGGRLMVARLGDGPAFRASAPEAMFRRPAGVMSGPGREHDIAPDGDRFLFARFQGAASQDRVAGLVFVQNWFQELLERVPVP